MNMHTTKKSIVSGTFLLLSVLGVWALTDATIFSLNRVAITASADDTSIYDSGSYGGGSTYDSGSYGGSSIYDSGSYGGSSYDSSSYSSYNSSFDSYTSYDSYDTYTPVYYDTPVYTSYYYSQPYYTNYDYNYNYNTPPPNPVCSLSVSPSTLNTPGDVTLSWNSSYATSGSIDNGVGSLGGASGSGTIYIGHTTTFTGTFSNSAGVTTQCSTTVTVLPPPAPTCTLTATPTSLTAPGDVTLAWTSTGAASGSIDQGLGNLTGPYGSGTTHVSQTTTYTATFLNYAGASVQCSATVTVTPPPPQNGCIQILKETFDPAGNKLSPVAQFSFKLDGGTTIQNDANGNAEFTNVTPGTHTISEVPAGSTWNLLSVTPANGTVTVQAGPTCAAVVFKNQQVVPVPTNGCIIVHKQTLDPAGHNLTPVAQFTFKLDGGVIAQNDANGNAEFTNVTPGAHVVSEVPAGSTWNQISTTPTGGQVTVASGSTCSNVNFVNQQVVPPPNAPSCTLSASPSTLSAPGTTNLIWTTNNATAASIDHGVGSVSPVSSGTVSVNVTATGTYTLTATGSSGTANCSTTVTIPPPPGPTCSLSITPGSITTGQPATLSWTSSNVSSGTIDNNVGNVGTSGSMTVFPPSSTTYTGTFTGTNGTVTCTVPITVITGGGCGNSCGGGLDQANVSLYKQPNQEPLAFVSLSQIPYTGFEAGPALTMIFWLAVAALAAVVAYGVAGEGSLRYLLTYVLGGYMGMPIRNLGEAEDTTHPHLYGHPYPVFDTEENIHAPAPSASSLSVSSSSAHTFATAPASIQMPPLSTPSPATRSYTLGTAYSAPAETTAWGTSSPVAPLPNIADVIESRAHAAGVLMSPEAVSLATGLSIDRAEALRRFGDILNDAVRTIPREDGWIMLTADRMQALSSKNSAGASQTNSAAATKSSASSDVSTAPTIDENAAAAFAGAVVSGDRESAFAIIRSLEHDGVKPTALMTGTATVLDALYRARHDQKSAPNAELADKASHVSDTQLAHLVEVFTHALDHVYASPFTGVKLALAQAFEVLS